MTELKQKPKGSFSHRFGIKFFSAVLAVLFYWLLGFFVSDIRSMKGPDYIEIEKELISGSLVDRKEVLEKNILDTERKIEAQKVRQEVKGRSSLNLQTTINQLLEMQKLGIQKNITFKEAEQKSFTDSLNLFLSNQKELQEINERIVVLNDELNQLKDQKYEVENKISEQKKPAEEKYRNLIKKHENRQAFLQLSILIPIMLASLFLVFRFRTSIYFPITAAFGISAFLKVTFIIHEYFPSRFFKYILILISILVIIKILIHFIRAIAFPKAAALIKQYREAYEVFLCPVCEYPIRRGPMKFLFWTRKTIKKLKISSFEKHEDKPYICPSCSTPLFEKCTSCSAVRTALLPYCEHCGNEKIL